MNSFIKNLYDAFSLYLKDIIMSLTFQIVCLTQMKIRISTESKEDFCFWQWQLSYLDQFSLELEEKNSHQKKKKLKLLDKHFNFFKRLAMFCTIVRNFLAKI